VVRGGSSDNQVTATEINAQIAGAGQRISLKVTQIENGYFHRMAKIVFEMVKLYVTEPMMVKVVGKKGANWEEFDPKDFQDNYEPRVQLDITVQARQQQQAANSKELLAAFLNDPDVNQPELKKLALQRGFDLDPDEVDMLMINQEELMAQQGQEMPMDGMPIEGEVMPTEGELPPIEALPPEVQELIAGAGQV